MQCRKTGSRLGLNTRNLDQETQKIMQSLLPIISHQMMPYSNAKSIWKLSLTCFRVFWALGHLGKLGPSTHISLEFLIFIFSTFVAWNLLSIMGSMINFGDRVQEILQNNYFKTNFGNSKIIEILSLRLEIS